MKLKLIIYLGFIMIISQLTNVDAKHWKPKLINKICKRGLGTRGQPLHTVKINFCRW